MDIELLSMQACENEKDEVKRKKYLNEKTNEKNRIKKKIFELRTKENGIIKKEVLPRSCIPTFYERSLNVHLTFTNVQ